MIENPNTYDDDKYAAAMLQTQRGIGLLWEAGASIQHIEAVVEGALEDLGLRTDFDVIIEGFEGKERI